MPVDLDFDEDTVYAWYEHGSVNELHSYHKGVWCTRKPVFQSDKNGHMIEGAGMPTLREELPDELSEDGTTPTGSDDGAVENAFADIHPVV